MQTVQTDKTVAVEILKQLGGNRFIVMTGAKNFCCDNNSICFKLPGTLTKNRINYVKIKLNVMDTYDVEFVSIWGANIKTIAKVDGIYNDMLQDTVANYTGLYLGVIR